MPKTNPSKIVHKVGIKSMNPNIAVYTMYVIAFVILPKAVLILKRK